MKKGNTLISLAAAAGLAFAGSALAEQDDSMAGSGASDTRMEKSGASTDPAQKQQKQQEQQGTQARDAAPARAGQAEGAQQQSPRATRAAAPIGQGEQYVVKQGDTLAELAQRFLGSADQWQQIASANDIQDPQQLQVGQRLTIPQGAQGEDRMMQQQRGSSPGAAETGAGGTEDPSQRPGSERP